MKKTFLLIAFLVTFLSQAQNETINGTLDVKANLGGILNLQTTDNSWLYTQWFDSSRTRKLWMGLNDNLSKFYINLENGVNTFTIPNGNVGIGTTTPTKTLDVNGTVNIFDQVYLGTDGKDVHIGNANSSVIKMYRAGYNYISAEHISGDLVFRTNATNRFIINRNSDIEFLGGNFIFKNGNKDWSLYPHNDNFYIRNITDGSNIVQVSSTQFTSYRPIHGQGGTGQHIFESSSDAPLITRSTDAASGIRFDDPNGQGNLYFFGNSNNTSQFFQFSNKVEFLYGSSFRASNSEYIMKSFNTSVGAPEQFSIKHNLENVELKNDRGNINFISKTVFDDNVIVNNGNIGIGTANPEYIMDVVSNQDDYKQFRVKSPGSPLIKLSGSYNTGNGAEFWQNTSGDIRLNINSSTSGLFIKSNGYIGVGTTTPDAKLAVNGKIHTKEVKIDLVGWPDYVFAKEYKLRTIEEVEKHIKEKGHLPNMPSAKEVEKNGVLLGKMNKRLLEKIEELTLYTIAQEKELKKQFDRDKKQEERLKVLEKENSQLKRTLKKIEAYLEKQKAR